MYVQGESRVWIDTGAGEPVQVAATSVSVVSKDLGTVEIAAANKLTYYAHISRVVVQQTEDQKRAVNPSWRP